MIFSCVYRPPSSEASWVINFHKCIEYSLSLNHPLCIMGDVNIDLIKDTSFTNNIDTFSLRRVIIEPTRMTKTSYSFIDHTFISHETLLSTTTVPSTCTSWIIMQYMCKLEALMTRARSLQFVLQLRCTDARNILMKVI